jgi:hypothetical protein
VEIEEEINYKVKNFNLEIKSIDTVEGIVTFYASVFNVKDSDGDIITENAFTKTLQERKSIIRHLYQHNFNNQVGKIIDIQVDKKGLLVTSKILNTSLGKDVLEMYKNDLLQHSIGFQIVRGEYKAEQDTYFINEVKLFEVSSVTLGANSFATTVSLKSSSEIEYNYLKLKEKIKSNTISEKEIQKLNKEYNNLKSLIEMLQDTSETNTVADKITTEESEAVKADEIKQSEVKKIDVKQIIKNIYK